MTDGEFIEDLRSQARVNANIWIDTETAARINAISGHKYWISRGLKSPLLTNEIARQLESRIAAQVAEQLTGSTK